LFRDQRAASGDLQAVLLLPEGRKQAIFSNKQAIFSNEIVTCYPVVTLVVTI
jgi:hypothetical protein